MSSIDAPHLALRPGVADSGQWGAPSLRLPAHAQPHALCGRGGVARKNITNTLKFTKNLPSTAPDTLSNRKIGDMMANVG
jgi:hypothetical protein